MPRRIEVALKHVPMFDVFQYKRRMYRKQKTASAKTVAHGHILATPMYREEGTQVQLMPSTLRVKWVTAAEE